MEENLKKLLRDMQDKENTRKNEIDQVNAEMVQIDLREETETDRFTEEMEEDRKSGIYNNRTDGQMQKIIDDEKEKIKSKYNSERLDVSNKLEEMKKQQDEEKKDDYREISSAIKEYHLNMVLEVNKANNELKLLENERNEKLKEIDNQISKKEAEYTHMIMKNRNFMDIEQSETSINIRILEQEIEELRFSRTGLDKEFGTRLKEKSDFIKQYSEQKERASKFMSSIRLSEKSVKEIYELLFDKEPVKIQNNVTEEIQPINLETGKNADEKTKKEKSPTPQSENNKETNSMKTTVVNANKQANQQINSKLNKEKSNKFSYEFSVKNGIKYDGKHVDIDDILIWYDENANEIEDAIADALGKNEKQEDIEWFLLKADKLIYSTIFKDTTIGENGKIIFGTKEKERIQIYYDMWNNPKSQKESNMTIKYNLKGMSKIQRFFSGSQLRDEEILDIKRNAFLLRDRNDVQIEKGPITTMYFKIMDKIEGLKNVKKLDEKTTNETNNETSKNPHQSFIDRLIPRNVEYKQIDNLSNQTVEEQVNDISMEKDER